MDSRTLNQNLRSELRFATAGAKLRCWGGKIAIRIVQYDPEPEPKNYRITQNRVFEDLEWA